MNGYVFLSITLVVGAVIVTAPRVQPWLDRMIKRLESNSERMRKGH
jgi:hypothetical protein